MSETMQEKAARLYVPGVFGYRTVADRLGVSDATVRRWLNPEHAERDRILSREAKRRRKQKCSSCAALMSYDNERGICIRCINAEIHPKIWTRETIIEAIQRWAKEHGRPPSATDWKLSRDYHPGNSSVFRTRHKTSLTNPFASWADAIEAAGFERPETGGRYRERPWLWKFDHGEAMRLLGQGLSQSEVARRLGCSQQVIWNLAHNGGTHAQRRAAA